MPDTPAKGLVDGPVGLDLVPVGAGQKATCATVLIVVLLLQLNLSVFNVGEGNTHLQQ